MEEQHELITDILLSRPVPFRLGKRRFILYPETLGTSVLISNILQSIEVDQEIMAINPTMEAMRLCALYPERIYEIVAIATLPGDECLNAGKVKKRVGIFSADMDRDDMIQMLMMILSRSHWQRLAKVLGIGVEQEEQRRIAQL